MRRYATHVGHWSVIPRHDDGAYLQNRRREQEKKKKKYANALEGKLVNENKHAPL